MSFEALESVFEASHNSFRRVRQFNDNFMVVHGETHGVAPQILIVLFLIYLFDNIIQLISLRSLWYYGGW
jgi:hypothetical protein